MPFHQNSDAKLTLTRVATAPALVAEIARSTGQKLEVAPALGSEVLMVSVEGVRAGDVLARLAVAATAAWQPIEGGYRLVPDHAARGLEASNERARRIQALSEGMRKRLAEAANRPIDALVPMLDVAALATMEAGDRIVFATSPTAVQRPIRGNPNPIVAGMIAQHNEQARKMTGPTDDTPDAFSNLLSGPLGVRFKRMSQVVTGTPAKIVVVASRGGLPVLGGDDTSDIRLEVRAYGADGKVMIEEAGALDANPVASAEKTSVSMEKSTPIAYSPEAKALVAASATASMGDRMEGQMFGQRSNLPAALRTYLLAPQRNDPLALIPGEGLAALAKARRKPLVALVPDEAFPSALASPAPKTVEEVESGLASGPMRIVPDATFLVVKAASPAEARTMRLDRNALAALLNAVADHGIPNLSEMAAFAVRTPDPAQSRLSQTELGFFAPSILGSITGLVTWPSLRLYGSLTSAQRETLQTGRQLPFTEISPAGKDALRTMVYGADEQLLAEGSDAIATIPSPWAFRWR